MAPLAPSRPMAHPALGMQGTSDAPYIHTKGAQSSLTPPTFSGKNLLKSLLENLLQKHVEKPVENLLEILAYILNANSIRNFLAVFRVV